MSEIFITSDTHFYHKNIVEGESEWGPEHYKRAFATREEMNEVLLNNINEKVGENDVLIHLGDWSMGGVDKIEIARNQIKCRHIKLICGNHDNKHGSSYDPVINKATAQRASSLFAFYGTHLEFFYKKICFVCFHYPLSSWNHMSKGAMHVHGHCHRTTNNRFINGGKSMDVGVDGNNFKPYHIEEIIDLLKDRPPKSEGHH